MATPAFAGTLLPPGQFSTSGAQIVGRNGTPVRLACIGWNQIYNGIPLARQTAMMAADGFNYWCC